MAWDSKGHIQWHRLICPMLYFVPLLLTSSSSPYLFTYKLMGIFIKRVCAIFSNINYYYFGELHLIKPFGI